MNEDIVDETVLKNVHGYLSCSDEDSDGESKTELDGIFEYFKPPPIFIDDKIHKIIEISAENNCRTQHMSYSSALKKPIHHVAISQNEGKIVSNEKKQNENKGKKKKKRKKGKKKKISKTKANDNNIDNLICDDIKHNQIVKENNVHDRKSEIIQLAVEIDSDGDKLFKLRKSILDVVMKKTVSFNEQVKSSENVGFSTKVVNSISAVERIEEIRDEDNFTFLDKNVQSYLFESMSANTEETSDVAKNKGNSQFIKTNVSISPFINNTTQIKEPNFFDNIQETSLLELDNVENCLSRVDSSQVLIKCEEDNTKSENRVVKIKKKKRKCTCDVPFLGCLFGEFHEIKYYLDYFPYETPNSDLLFSFKDTLLNSQISFNKNETDILEKITDLLKSYQSKIYDFIDHHPTDSYRVFEATYIFRKRLNKLGINLLARNLNLEIIFKIATLFENFSKSLKTFDYRNCNSFKARVDEFNNGVDMIFESFFTATNVFKDSMKSSNPLIRYLNKNLTIILENIVLKCKIKLDPSKDRNVTYSPINMISTHEEILKFFDVDIFSDQNRNLAIDENLKKDETAELFMSKNDSLNVTGSKDDDYGMKKNNQTKKNLPNQISQNQSRDSNHVRSQESLNALSTSETVENEISEKIFFNPLIIEDLTENRKYYYDNHSKVNQRKWRQFQTTYLNKEIETGRAPLQRSPSIVEDMTYERKYYDIDFNKVDSKLSFSFNSDLGEPLFSEVENRNCDSVNIIHSLERPLLRFQKLCNEKWFFELVFLIIISKITIFSLLYQLIILLVFLIFYFADIILLIFLLIYLCMIFVIKI